MMQPSSLWKTSSDTVESVLSALYAGVGRALHSLCRVTASTRGRPFNLGRCAVAAIVLLLGIGTGANAQQSERFDQFELHQSVVYTTFLSAEVAAQYGISRGKDKAILTLSVRDAESGETAGRPMAITGRTWDFIHGGDLELKEIREGRATYYIAAFEFLDREWRFFEFDFKPQGSERTYHHEFKVQLWKQED